MQEHAGRRTRLEAHEAHLQWLRTQWSEYNEHMRAAPINSHGPSHQFTRGESSAIELDATGSTWSTEDEFSMPIYRSLGSLAVSDEGMLSSPAAAREREAGLPQHSGVAAMPSAEAAAEAAEQAWLSDMRPPLVKRQRAFERTSI